MPLFWKSSLHKRLKASNKTLTRANGRSTCCLNSDGTKPELNWLPMLPGYACWCLCMVARSGAGLGSRSPCDGCPAAVSCRSAAFLRAHSRCPSQRRADQNTSVSITLCIHGPIMPRRYSRAADSRSMGRPLHNTVRDCSEDPTLGPARPRPSAGGPLFTPVDATLCVVEAVGGCQHATGAAEATTRERIHHISWNGPGK